VLINDESLKPLLQAAASFDRVRYGFTSIPNDPTTSAVSVESKPHDGYDAMLHITTKTYRTIAFRRTSAGYEWIGEQEVFQGPKRYKTVDGTFNEAIYGEDPRLANMNHLTLRTVQPILSEWSY